MDETSLNYWDNDILDGIPLKKEFWDGYTFDCLRSTIVDLQNHRFRAKDCDTTYGIQIKIN